MNPAFDPWEIVPVKGVPAVSRCPVCGLYDGFHADPPTPTFNGPYVMRVFPGHAAARDQIPAHLTRPGSKAEKRSRIVQLAKERITS